MSLNENTVYLESARDNFDTYLSQGDYAGCKTIIDDLRQEGFEKEAHMLSIELLSKPITMFK